MESLKESGMDKDAELKVKTKEINNVRRQVSNSFFFLFFNRSSLLPFSRSWMMKLPMIYYKCQRQAQQTAVLSLSEPSRAWGRQLYLSINCFLLSSATTQLQPCWSLGCRLVSFVLSSYKWRDKKWHQTFLLFKGSAFFLSLVQILLLPKPSKNLAVNVIYSLVVQRCRVSCVWII